MGKFIRITAMLTAILLIGCFIVFSFANGQTDHFYLRFTAPKQTSLILGSSRAAQGIQPDLLAAEMGELLIFNYAFTLLHSPYGETYRKSIFKKLKPSKEKGIFILDVSPLNLSVNAALANDPSKFPETKNAVCNPLLTNINPNPFYLINHYDKPFFTLLAKTSSNLLLHDDGWLEVSVPMDSASFHSRLQKRLDHYRPLVKSMVMSAERMNELDLLIQLLKPNGQIFIVRIPTHESILQLEQELSPDFNLLMIDLARKHDVAYFDYSSLSGQFTYTDGNHLWKESGADFTRLLAEDILFERREEGASPNR